MYLGLYKSTTFVFIGFMALAGAYLIKGNLKKK